MDKEILFKELKETKYVSLDYFSPSIGEENRREGRGGKERREVK